MYVVRQFNLTAAQLDVLRWIAEACPERDWPNTSHKRTTRALADCGLADVRRKKKVWTATITEAGQYYLDHGRPLPRREPAWLGPEVDVHARPQGGRASEHATSDATARAMRRVANRARPREVKRTRREVRETYMRYKVVVTRVQVAERFVRATSEEDAAAKVQAEFDRPYGYFGSWKTTSSEVDVVEAEQTTVILASRMPPNRWGSVIRLSIR